MSNNVKEKDYLDHVNPERRDFVKKMAKTAFVVPVVVSVSMLEQRLSVATAQAQSPEPEPGPGPQPPP